MSRTAKLGVVAVGLLVLAVVVNWAMGYTLEDVLHAYAPRHQWQPRPLMARLRGELPKPKGPEDAPVKITVFAMSASECPFPLLQMLDEAYKKYPNVLRIVYKDMTDPEIHKLALEHKIGCLMGVLINGKNQFRFPGREGFEVVMFQGPPHPSPPEGHEPPGGFHGVPGYTANDFYAAIEQELKAAGIDPNNLPPAKAAPKPKPAAEKETTNSMSAAAGD